jgi:hypothetical protein
LKIFEIKETKGPKPDSQNRLRSHMPEHMRPLPDLTLRMTL